MERHLNGKAMVKGSTNLLEKQIYSLIMMYQPGQGPKSGYLNQVREINMSTTQMGTIWHHL